MNSSKKRGRPKLPPKPMSKFANRLYKAMDGRNISAFEEENGLSKSTIHKIYAGAEPTRPTLEAIIKGTGCNALWLITGEGDMFGDEGFPPASPREIKPAASKNDLLEIKAVLLDQAAAIDRLLDQ